MMLFCHLGQMGSNETSRDPFPVYEMGSKIHSRQSMNAHYDYFQIRGIEKGQRSHGSGAAIRVITGRSARSAKRILLRRQSNHHPLNLLNYLQSLPGSPAPRKIERFYSEDWRTERWILFVFSLPLSFVVGLAFYLFFTGTSQWLVGVVMLSGFVIFSLAGFLIEQQSLKQFACPRCEAPIEDWDTNETHRVLFHCAHCKSSWDIEFKPRPEVELHPSGA